MEGIKSIQVVSYLSYFMSLLFTAMGAPLALRLIEPNSLYGVRTQNTLQDQSVWYSINESAGTAMVIAGVLSIALIYVVSNYLKLRETASVVTICLIPIVLPALAVATALLV